jgi:N-alpha-acetyltransferase 40
MPPKKTTTSSSSTDTRLGATKKELRRLEAEFIKARKVVLDAANDNADHLSVLPAFKTFKCDPVDVSVSYCASVPDDATLQACFDLLKANMEQHYVTSYGKWSDKAKLAELKSDAARFLLVRDASGKLVGFVHLRFEWEADDLVLYVMEIQLDGSVRRKGLGKRLMQTLELIARKAGLDGILLTVLGSDADARRFYDRLAYEAVYSADADVERDDNMSFAIMRKSFPSDAAKAHHTNEVKTK